MRWVFEICLFEPNGELQFRKPVFSIFDALVFPPTEPEQERLSTFMQVRVVVPF